jgi:dsDNA-specific endonuclease/ATPase MutS2
MNAHSLRVLEFDKVRAMLREKCASSLGIELVESLRPDTEVRRISERQKETLVESMT